MKFVDYLTSETKFPCLIGVSYYLDDMETIDYVEVSSREEAEAIYSEPPVYLYTPEEYLPTTSEEPVGVMMD